MRNFMAIAAGLSALALPASPAPAQPAGHISTGVSTGASMMETACRAGDFGGFFEGFSRASWAERQAYLAPTIRVAKVGKIQSVPRARYRGYDIILMDYSYATASSVAQFEAGKRPDFDKITYAAVKLPQNSYRVDWSRGTFAVADDDAEESVVRRFGPKQNYVFQKTARCWQLSEDRTGPSPIPARTPARARR